MDSFEEEQLEYIRRNQMEFNVSDDTDMFPNATKTEAHKQIILTPEQEMKIIQEIKKSVTPEIPSPKPRKFSISLYLDIISISFMGIMDDLFKFDGNMENFADIFFKEDRVVFLASIVIAVSIGILYYR
jgi:hypothetical protein